MSIWSRHKTLEKNSIFLCLGIALVVSIGGLIEIVPSFYLKSTIEDVEGMRPYSPLELAGRNIYVENGCYNCHSQMIRTLRDEVERYGHYSLAAESMYDHPFQWGSKRTGPDLARQGGKNSDRWHQDHFRNPRFTEKASIMPGYPFLEQRELDVRKLSQHMRVLAILGVPYSDEMIEKASADAITQATTDADESDAFLARYPKSNSRDFDGNPGKVTEADALIAYMQLLGTLVEFKQYKAIENIR